MKIEVPLEVPSLRWKSPSRLAMIAAVLFTSLLVGATLLVLQAGHSSQIASQIPASQMCSQYHSSQTGSQAKSNGSSQSLYLSQKGEVERIDPQTCASVWRTSIPSKSSSPNYPGKPIVIGDTVYLASDQLFALDRKNGHIRWSREGMNWPSMDGGLLYVENDVINVTAVSALNPSDGTIKATYQAPAGGWKSPVVANGILYYATNTDLSALRLSDKKLIWHQPMDAHQPLESLQVKNGIIYAQISGITDGRVIAFDVSKGKKLWESASIPTGVRTLTITDTTIYIASFKALDALNARSGKPMWHQQINTGQMLANQDTLYIGYLNEPLKEGSTGIAALKARDGTVLWQESIAWQIADTPLGLQDGTLYGASNNGTNGEIEAFKTSDGSLLWHIPIKGNIWEVTFA